MMAWTGFGWVGYAVILGSFFASVAALDFLFGAGYARQHSALVAGCMFVTTTACCWPVGRYFNRDLPVRLFDGDWAWEGRTSAHSTFFIRLEFAGLVGLPVYIAVAITGVDWLR